LHHLFLFCNDWRLFDDQANPHDCRMNNFMTGATNISPNTLAIPPRAKVRQQYSLAEKLMIVRESRQSGISQAAISRKYSLGKNVLWSWRKSLANISKDAMDTCSIMIDPGLLGLQERVAELERLLGQKALEIEILRNRLHTI
jgi:transposase-like protein